MKTIPFHTGAFALAGLTLTLTAGMGVVGPKGVPQTECPINTTSLTISTCFLIAVRL